MQSKLHKQFGMESRGLVSTYTKYETFKRKTCVCKGKRPNWPFVSDGAVECIRACFQSSQKNSPWLRMRIVLRIRIVQILLAVSWPTAGNFLSVEAGVNVYKTLLHVVAVTRNKYSPVQRQIVNLISCPGRQPIRGR